MLNRVDMMGRLCSDPEIRRTTSGVAVTNFTIACDRDFGNNGEKETDFVEVVCWRNTAEFVSKYFSKGRMAVVSGRLQMRKWTDKNGNNRVTAEIVADNVYFGDSKQTATDNSVAPSFAAPAQDFNMLEGEDVGLPF